MWTSIRFTLVTFVLAGIIYPLSVMLAGQFLFPHQANGSLIKNPQNQVIGSELIGQAFTRPDYFHPRPSANTYDAANSGGSNFGSTSQKLIDRVKKDLSAYQQENKIAQGVPVDAVTASSSGLDPHITVANAMAQVPRVAQARKLDSGTVRSLVQKTAEHPLLGPESYVNVLKLNLALDGHK